MKGAHQVSIVQCVSVGRRTFKSVHGATSNIVWAMRGRWNMSHYTKTGVYPDSARQHAYYNRAMRRVKARLQLYFHK